MRTSVLVLGCALVAGGVGCNAIFAIDEPTSSPKDAGADTFASPDAATPDAATCEKDISRDPDHCGVCGHSCLGGTCENGQCQPIILAADQVRPYRIAVEPADDGFVYFTNYPDPSNYQPSVRSVPKDRRLPWRDLDTGARSVAYYRPTDLALRGGKLYWTSADDGSGFGRVFWANTDGTDLAWTQSTWKGPWGIFSASDDVYFANRWDEVVVERFNGGTPSAVHRAPAPHSDSYGVYFLVVDDGPDGFIYLTSGDGVQRMKKDGSDHRVIDNGPAAVLGWDRDTLYVGNPGIGVRSLARDGTGSKLLAGTNDPMSIAADDTHVYFTTKETVERVKKDGSGREVLVRSSRATEYDGVTLDATAIYFAARGPGQILRLAK